MENEEKKLISFMDILAPLHFYASCAAGWFLFHDIVYPFTHFSQESTEIVKLLPIYFLNLLAFACLTYVATRPLVILIDHGLGRFDRVLEDLMDKR